MISHQCVIHLEPGLCKSPLENIELDKPLVRSMVSEVEFNVVVKQGISRREAMALIHHSSAVICREISYEVVKDQCQSLQPLVTRDAYFNALKGYVPMIPDSLDLEEPPRPAFPLRKAMEVAERLYAKIVDRSRAKAERTVLERTRREGKQEA